MSRWPKNSWTRDFLLSAAGRLTGARARLHCLWVRTPIGGVARYENDYYYRRSDDIERVAGNPWFICALWLAQWWIALAQTPDALRRRREILE